jgi:hypothetical protein
MNWEEASDEASDETERDILDDLNDPDYPDTDYLIDRAIEEIKHLRYKIEVLNMTIREQNEELIELHKANDERENP